MSVPPPTTEAKARRLGGCLAYLLAGLMLVLAARHAVDWWEQSRALRSGNDYVIRLDFDDRGNAIGEHRTPATPHSARGAQVAALVLGGIGLGALVAGLLLQGMPWRALTPAVQASAARERAPNGSGKT